VMFGICSGAGSPPNYRLVREKGPSGTARLWSPAVPMRSIDESSPIGVANELLDEGGNLVKGESVVIVQGDEDSLNGGVRVRPRLPNQMTECQRKMNVEVEAIIISQGIGECAAHREIALSEDKLPVGTLESCHTNPSELVSGEALGCTTKAAV